MREGAIKRQVGRFDKLDRNGVGFPECRPASERGSQDVGYRIDLPFPSVDSSLLTYILLIDHEGLT